MISIKSIQGEAFVIVENNRFNQGFLSPIRPIHGYLWNQSLQTGLPWIQNMKFNESKNKTGNTPQLHISDLVGIMTLYMPRLQFLSFRFKDPIRFRLPEILLYLLLVRHPLLRDSRALPLSIRWHILLFDRGNSAHVLWRGSHWMNHARASVCTSGWLLAGDMIRSTAGSLDVFGTSDWNLLRLLDANFSRAPAIFCRTRYWPLTA